MQIPRELTATLTQVWAFISTNKMLIKPLNKSGTLYSSWNMVQLTIRSFSTCTYNVLIRGFCKNSMVDEGFRFFREMESFNCDADVVTYNTLVDGLCRAGKVRIARNLVNGMGKKCEGLNPNVVTYTTLIRGYCMKQEVEEALVVLEEMTSRGLKPNMTYNTLVKSC